jgi:hypothetical protein
MTCVMTDPGTGAIWLSTTRRPFRAEAHGHQVTFEFDKSGVVINRGRVQIDGKQVDERAVFYGESKISGRIDDRDFEVRFASGIAGQLKHVELRVAGEEIPLVEDQT